MSAALVIAIAVVGVPVACVALGLVIEFIAGLSGESW